MVFNVESDIVRIKESHWRLTLKGQVENPLSLSLEKLKNDFEQEDVTTNILCLRGVTIKGTWTGVGVNKLLEAAGAQSEARWIQAKAYSDYAEPIRFNDANKHGVIIAYNLDGKPIPKEQGGFLRFVVPDKYAYKSVKWIKELTILDERPSGFWEKKGFPYKDS